MNKTDITRAAAMIAVSAIVAFSFGFSYGNVGNQVTYLPHALNFLHPDFLRHDWLVHETQAYHGNFRWVITGLSLLGSVAWGVAVLNTLLITVGLLAIYCIAKDACPEYPTATYLMTILFISMDRTVTIAGSYLFSDGLQPSTIASVAWLFAIGYFFRQRFGASGIMLAIAGLFHVNFLVLGIGLFALSHLMLGRLDIVKRQAQQIGPSMLVLAFAFPLIMSAADGEHAAYAREIFQKIRAPHHYVPASFQTDFFYFGGWVAIGLGAALARSNNAMRRVALAFLGSAALCIVGATCLTTAVFIAPVAQLFVWRIAPFALVVSQILVAAWAMQHITATSQPKSRRDLLILAVMAAGGLCILRWYLYRYPALSLPVISLVSIAVLFAGLLLCRRFNVLSKNSAIPVAGVAAAVLASFFVAGYIPDTVRSSKLFAPDSSLLYQWTRRSADDAVFLIPPNLQDFRLLGERGIVVDWKSTPIKANELILWYDRINTVSGRRVMSLNDSLEGYRTQSMANLRATAEKYGAQYIVIDRRTHVGDMGQERALFDDGKFQVFSAHSPGATAMCCPGSASTADAIVPETARR